jgi:hypothetical protein
MDYLSKHMNATLKSRLRGFGMAVVGGAIGFGTTFLFMDFLEPVLKLMHPAWLLAVAPLSIFTAVLIHELGHVAGGAANGFRFSYMSVFFLKVEKKQERITAGFNRTLSTWGGLAVMIPPAGVSRANYLWFVAGGPLGGITGVLLSGLGLYFLYPNQPVAALFCAFSLFINALLTVVTMMPLKLDDNFDTDGIQFFDLLRGGDRAGRKLAMARLMQVATSGIRPAEYPEEFIQAIERSGPPDRDTLFAVLFRSAAQMDRKDWHNALASLRLVIAHIEKLPPIIKRMTYLQAATVEGFNGNAAGAQELLQKAGSKGWADKSSVALANAAAYYAAGQLKEMLPLLDEAEREIPNIADPGTRIMYQDLVQDLRKKRQL